jgi:hypothetical protein
MSHPHTPPPPKGQTCMRVSEKFALHQTHNTTSIVRLDARNHYPQIKHHTPPPKQGNNKNPHPRKNPRRSRPAHTLQRGRDRGLVVSKPNSVSDDFSCDSNPVSHHMFVVHQTPTHYR